MKQTDFREHVFTATGKDTDLAKFSAIDAYDNIAPELDRLAAIADVLGEREELAGETASGIGLLLTDIHRRITLVMSTLMQSTRPKKGPG